MNNREEWLDAVREHEDTVSEIAAGNAPDSHVARVLLALARGEDPSPDDLEKLCRRANEENT